MHARRDHGSATFMTSRTRRSGQRARATLIVAMDRCVPPHIGHSRSARALLERRRCGAFEFRIHRAPLLALRARSVAGLDWLASLARNVYRTGRANACESHAKVGSAGLDCLVGTARAKRVVGRHALRARRRPLVAELPLYASILHRVLQALEFALMDHRRTEDLA
jgi:hypothetical protein